MFENIDRKDRILLSFFDVDFHLQILSNKRLSYADKSLYSYLFLLTLKNEQFPFILEVSAERAMDELKMSLPQYYKSRQNLLEYGYIQCYNKEGLRSEGSASNRIELCEIPFVYSQNNYLYECLDNSDDTEDYIDEEDLDDEDCGIDSKTANLEGNKQIDNKSSHHTKNITIPFSNVPSLTITQLREMYPSDDPSYDPDHYVEQRFDDELTMCKPKKKLTPEEIYQSTMLYSVMPGTTISWHLRLKNLNKLPSDKRKAFIKGMQKKDLEEFDLIVEYDEIIGDEQENNE